MVKKSVRLPAHIKPERYQLMLRPDLENFTFSGEETIELILEREAKEITLHSQEIEIESAEFIHQGKTNFASKITYQPEDETATFNFPKSLKKGKGELVLKFKGILNDKLRGFYRSRYSHEGQDKYLATTQFEATDARRAFPSFDEPSKKAIFDVTLMIPANTIAISNTIEKNVWEHESGYKVVEFEPTPKMSTYLLAFIVGDLEYIEGKTKRGVLVRVFTTPGKKEQGRFALNTAIKMLEFYEEYFKIPYPLPVSDLIAIPDFAAGAMENWGAVTYRETALLIDEANSSAVNRQRVAVVIAHELAHMWFGDLVTMEWWTHLWLNEGFASYIEYLAVDHVFPEFDIWTQFIHMDQGTALKLDSLENTHPIEVEVFHPSEISEIFDKVSYSKGASIIRMLAQFLGPKDFREGLRHYLKTHEYSNASTEDLWRSFEEVSGKPVRKLMKNWTSKPGYPLLVLEEGKNNLTVSQTRYFSSPISKKETKDKTIWSIPLQISRENSKKVEQYLIEERSLNIPKSKKGEWIKLNSNEASFIRVDYSAKALGEFKEPIRQKRLEVIDRLGIVRDAFDLSESGNLPTHFALELALDYQDEDDFTIWGVLSSRMSQVGNLIADEKFYPEFESYGREVFSKIAQRLGWEKQTGEPHTNTLLRSLSLYALGSYKDPDTIKKALELWNSVKNIEPDLRGVVYAIASENGDQKTYKKLLKMYKETDNQQEKDRISRALSSFEQVELLQKTLEFAISDEVRAQDAVFVIAGVGANPKGRELTWEFIKKNWKLFKERYGGGHFLLASLLQSVDGLVKNSDAEDIEQFFKKNPAPEAKRTISQVLEQIRSNAIWLERDSKGTEQFLKDFGRIKN